MVGFAAHPGNTNYDLFLYSIHCFFQQTKIKWCEASEMIYCCKKEKI